MLASFNGAVMLSFFKFIVSRKKIYLLPILFVIYGYGWLHTLLTNFFAATKSCQICGKGNANLYTTKDGGSGSCCEDCYNNS